MKTAITTAILFSALFFASCGKSNNKKTEESAKEQVETAMYQCPMKCEGEKMYDEPGTCPVCKMDLEIVSKEDVHKHHNH